MSVVAYEASSATTLHLPMAGSVTNQWRYPDDGAGVGADRISTPSWMTSNVDLSSRSSWSYSRPIFSDLDSIAPPHRQRLRTPHPAAQLAAVTAAMVWHSSLSANSLTATSATLTDVNYSVHTALFARLYLDGITAHVPSPTYVRSAEAQSLVNKIAGFRALAHDWAGDETEPVTQDAVDAAAIAIDAADAADLSLPSPSPSADGEIGLTWFSGRDRLALTVTRDMHMVWVTSINRKVEEGQDVEVRSQAFPGLLVEALREFYRQASGSMPLPERR